MDANENAGCLIPRGVRTTIASIRASTGCSYREARSNCGSEPAREGGITFNISVD